MFGVDLPGILLATHGSSYDDATLLSVTAGDRDPEDLAAGTPLTPTPYPCKAKVVDYSPHELGDLVVAGDRKLQILARSIADGTVAPKPGDQVTIGGVTYDIPPERGAVTHDPSVAVYECRVRG